jgi:hypothetical protein
LWDLDEVSQLPGTLGYPEAESYLRLFYYPHKLTQIPQIEIQILPPNSSSQRDCGPTAKGTKKIKEEILPSAKKDGGPAARKSRGEQECTEKSLFRVRDKIEIKHFPRNSLNSRKEIL